MDFEVCCGSISDAIAAELGGATRIELNSALSLGGLTPDYGGLILCREEVNIPIIAMLRPRAGGFCYTNDEVRTMFTGAECLLKAGVDGIAFGFLTPEREVEQECTKRMVELIHSYGKCAVFHRAFDCVRSFTDAAEALIEAGTDRILTSGGEQTAWEGRSCLHNLKQIYGDKIGILAGSGIRSKNVTALLEAAALDQVHSSCRGFLQDMTARGNGVSFSYEGLPKWYSYEAVSYEEVRAMKQALIDYTERHGLDR